MAIGRARPPARAVPSHRRGSALRIRDLRVRTKLLLVLAIPLVGFLTVTGVQVITSIETAAQLDGLSRQVALGREINALVHELQRERDRTAGMLAAANAPGSSGAPNPSDLSPDRTAVDRAAAALASAAEPLRGDVTFERTYQAAATGLAELPRIRDGTQSGWLRGPAAFDAYTRIIADLHALMLVPAAGGGDAGVGRAVQASVQATRAKELTAQIRGLLFAVCSSAGFGPDDFEVVTDVRAQRQAAVERFRGDASPAQLASWDAAVSGQAVRNASRLEQTMVDNAAAAELGVDAQQWWQASTTQLELIRGAEQQLLNDAIGTAEARSAAQQRTSQLVTLASVLLLAVALLTSFLIGRTMVRTLHSLREQALDIAQHKLPEMIEKLRTSPKGAPSIVVDPIAIRSGDEVGEVAEAFTAVHRNAVRLAAEQALMRHNVNAIYVNLARRSQTLVERQLQLLDALESSEADPDQLANLFRLDHLATRMRRNDDNLLVLAGGDASRRWSEPVPLTAVVLAAAAEIEHYTRVRHDIADNIHVVGHVVADLVHLLAELLENATVFSPSDTTVSVLGWASDRGAVLVIQDEGLGMSPQAIARANRQLAAPVSIDVAAAERMGLVVVGHLAHRHRIHTELRSSGRGVAVLVALPQELLAEPGAYRLPWAAGEAGPAEWLRTEREAVAAGAASPPAPTDSALSRIEGPAPPSVAGQPRRATPTRAEDVLGAGRVDSGSIWWSRQPAGAAGAASAAGAAIGAAPAVPRQRPAAQQTTAGLPLRVPMSHLPGSPGAPGPERAARPARETDPAEVGNLLSRFYGGVHRAVAEDDEDLHAVK
jgi:hypothetical protein